MEKLNHHFDVVLVSGWQCYAHWVTVVACLRMPSVPKSTCVRSCMAAAWCRTRLILLHNESLLFWHRASPWFSPHPHTEPPPCSSFRHRRSHASLSSEPRPLRSLFPHSSSHREHSMADAPPILWPLVIPLRGASTAGALCHHRRHPGYKMPPCLPLHYPTPRSEAERVESVFSVNAQVGEAREAVRKEVVGGRAMRSSRCSQV
jgi:hypothetical protein